MAKVPCPPYDPCSLLGNTDFELPVKPIGSATYYPKDTIPCWDTDQAQIEIWTTGANVNGPKLTPTGLACQPYTGTQFVELNSEGVAPFFQTFTVPSGGMTGATLSFAHAGRSGCFGTNQMIVKILAGAGSGGAIEYTAPGNRPGNIYDANFEPDGITSKSEQIWTYYTIVLPFIAAGTHTIVFDSVPLPCCPVCDPPYDFSCACGNFLDSIDIQLQNPTVTVTASPAIITVGGVINLSANNTTDVVSWEWTQTCYPPGAPPVTVIIGTTQNISIPALTVDLEGCDYCCEVTNAFGCKAQACVNVKVLEGPACYRIIDCLGIQPDFITNTDMSDYLEKTIRICYYADSVDSDDCVPVPPECPHWPKGCYCVTVERVTVGCTSCPLEALIEAVYCDCEECLPKTYFQLLDCCTKEPYKVDGVTYELSFNGMTSGPLPSDVDHRVLTTMVTNTGTITGCFELTIVDFNIDSVYNRWDDTVISVVTVAECADCQVCKTCFILTDCTDDTNILVVGQDLSEYINDVITIDGCKDTCWIVTGPVPDCVTESSTTTSTQTTTTSVQTCCWKTLLKGQTISILINGNPTNVPLGSATSMQTYLNGLSLGVWTVVEAPANIFTFCVVGNNTYGNMTLVDNQTIEIVNPSCKIVDTNTTYFTSTQICDCSEGCDVISNTDTTTQTETIINKHCCWDGEIKENTTSVTMMINGVPVSIPFTLSQTNILLYLNGLSLGTFTGTFAGGTFGLCVDGTEVYGNIMVSYTQGTPLIVNPVCRIDEEINILISTYTTCICANGNPPVDPCIGCTPSIIILNVYPNVQGRPNCAACLPEPPAPIPLTLHPRKIKPGYDTPGCDPAYTQKVSCTFGEQVYDAMVAVRYGIKICCDHDLQKWNIRKQLLDLRAIYDPALCANLIPPCPESCPPVCPVDPVICYCYTIFHQTTGSTTYKYTECLLGTVILFTSSEIEAVNVCSRTIPVIVEISCGTEMSIIETVQASCTTNQDCSTLPLPCQCWEIQSWDGCIFDYIDCNGVNQTVTTYPGKNYICSAIEPTPGINCKISTVQSLGECTDTSICNNLPCLCWRILLDLRQTCIYEYIDCDGNVLRINCVEGNNYVCSRVQPYHPDDVPVCLSLAIEFTGNCGLSYYCNTCTCYAVTVSLRDGDFVDYIDCDNNQITVNLPANSSIEPYYICSKILPFANASTIIVEKGACADIALCNSLQTCSYWVVTSSLTEQGSFTYRDCCEQSITQFIESGQAITICASTIGIEPMGLSFYNTNIKCLCNF